MEKPGETEEEGKGQSRTEIGEEGPERQTEQRTQQEKGMDGEAQGQGYVSTAKAQRETQVYAGLLGPVSGEAMRGGF